MIKTALVFIMFVLALYPPVTSAKTEPTCVRYAQKAQYGGEIFYYWREINPTAKHGICANMYSDVSLIDWYVEKPTGVNPTTHMSTSTKIERFKSRKAAEDWAEAQCPSIGSFDTIH